MAIALTVVGLHLVLPVLGLFWLGIRNERIAQERLLRASVRLITNTKKV